MNCVDETKRELKYMIKFKESSGSFSKNGNDANQVGQIKIKNAAYSMRRREYSFIFYFYDNAPACVL